tara:strand:+ start:613 stop:1311 length:699 start_codon:yes stop_codon:yes gene_type:complete
MYKKDVELFFEFNEKKVVISAWKNLKKLFYSEIFIDNKSKEFLIKLENGIKESIIKVEKIANLQINDVNIILNLNRTQKITLNVPNKVDNKISNYDDLIYLIQGARQNILRNNKHLYILHIIMDNIYYDFKKYKNYDFHKKHQNFSIDLQFHCYPLHDIAEFKELFRKINLSINKFICFDYLMSFKNPMMNSIDLHLEAYKILQGQNKKEVQIVEKKQKNIGLFEKIFQFFS